MVGPMSEKFSAILSEIELGFTVDWLSITFDPNQGYKFARKLGYKAWASEIDCVPQKGYTNAHELETGMRVNWNTKRNDMGLHVILSGSTLRYYLNLGVDWHQIMTWAKEARGKCSRVDLAIDIRNSGLKMADFGKETLKPYRGKGRTPTPLPIGNEELGWTWYYGKRGSKKCLRVYHKGLEQKLKGVDYIRAELELKSEYARAVGVEFPSMPKERCVDMARTLMRTVADWSMPAWEYAMRGETVALALPEAKDKDTLGWLLNVCVPALARQIDLRPNENVYDQFHDALRRELQKRGFTE